MSLEGDERGPDKKKTTQYSQHPQQLLAGDKHLRKSLLLYYLEITQSRIKIERFIFSFCPKANKDGRKRLQKAYGKSQRLAVGCPK